MNEASITAANFKRIGKGTLMATADITIVKMRMTILGCMWHRKNDKDWLSIPSKEWVDRAGKRQFSKLIEFTDAEVGGRFYALALDEMLKLGGEAPDHAF